MMRQGVPEVCHVQGSRRMKDYDYRHRRKHGCSDHRKVSRKSGLLELMVQSLFYNITKKVTLRRRQIVALIKAQLLLNTPRVYSLPGN
jgi:hypothetical protein